MRDREYFPDGMEIDEWFYNAEEPSLQSLGKRYILTDYGVLDDGKVYTQKIQCLIDYVAGSGGGVIVVPEGTYRTGALFFKQGVHLYISKNGCLLGSDDISDYPVVQTRIEGESGPYFSALINAEGVDGFTMCGEGILDGNGRRSWKAFWLRRQWNPRCTNKDEQRPRLVYIANSTNVTVFGLRIQNSHFWTNHLYKCHHVKFIRCDIYSPYEPIPSPSTDGLDIDACTDILVKNCRFEVNDDAIALKGGKGPCADTLAENGANERILIEDCEFGPCCAMLTCGSEAIYNKNILMRKIKADGPGSCLWLKMRPDTPQLYEYIRVEEMVGFVGSFLLIKPWTQFFDLKGGEKLPPSLIRMIFIKNCHCKCRVFFDVKVDKTQYQMSDVFLENIEANADEEGFNEDNTEGLLLKNIEIIQGK